jgi:hypothetical protein
LEDVIHWILLGKILIPLVISSPTLGVAINVFLFALGHLGTWMLALDLWFWKRKFPTMLVAGVAYRCLGDSLITHFGPLGICGVTLVHIIFNLIVVYIYQKVDPEKPGDWLTAMAIHTKMRRAKMTASERRHEDEAYERQSKHFAEELSKIDLSQLIGDSKDFGNREQEPQN